MILAASVQAYQSKSMRCMNDLQSLSTSLNAFHYQYGKYPAPVTWRDELVGTSNCILNVHHIRFMQSDRQLLDPWGNGFVFVEPGNHNTNSFDLYSFGRDGKSTSNGNDPDDINNWSPDHPWLYKAYGFVTQEQAERREKIIFAFPFVVLSFAIVTEIILVKKWIKKRKRKSQPPLSPAMQEKKSPL